MEVTKPTISIRAAEAGSIIDTYNRRMKLKDGARAVSYDVVIHNPHEGSAYAGPFDGIPTLKKYLGTLNLKEFRGMSDVGKTDLEKYVQLYNEQYKPKIPHSVEELPNGKIRLNAGKDTMIYRPLNESEIKELSDIINIINQNFHL